MGKIFGISDLPVSTIMSPFEHISLKQPGQLGVKISEGMVDNKFIKRLPSRKSVLISNILNGLKQPFSKSK